MTSVLSVQNMITIEALTLVLRVHLLYKVGKQVRVDRVGKSRFRVVSI